MLRAAGWAAATWVRTASSANRAITRGDSAARSAVTSTSTMRPAVAARSSRSRRRATRDPGHHSSLARRTELVFAAGSCRRTRRTVATTRRAPSARVGRNASTGTTTTGAGTGVSAGGERREREREPGEEEPQQDARREPHDEQGHALRGEPPEERPRPEPQRLEQRELAKSLRRAHGDAHEEADRREDEGRDRPEPEDPDDAEPERVAGELLLDRRPVEDVGRRDRVGRDRLGDRGARPVRPSRATTRWSPRAPRRPPAGRGRAPGRRRAQTAWPSPASGSRRPRR